MKRWLWAALMTALMVALCTLSSGLAWSAPESASSEAQASFSEAAEAISRGAHSEAIDKLELLADHGFVHPDVSFNRGVAYLARARGTASRPGDRGRAMASFRETLILRPDDQEARRLIDEVQQELGRQRARKQGEQHIEAPAPTRALVSLLHENSWAALAALFSAATALGLGLRFWRRRQSQVTAGSWRLAGAILASVGMFGLLLTSGATALGRSMRQNTQTAVVIVEDARLLQDNGRPLHRPPLPEGTEVYVLQVQGPLAQVEQSSGEAWIRRSDIRVLVTPPAPISTAAR